MTHVKAQGMFTRLCSEGVAAEAAITLVLIYAKRAGDVN